ncbi:hydrogenase expression/formation protein HypD [Ruminococcus sp. YE71]|uniref:hydrogenase formation protein HypD n=1 Tax=unclassified Ruminococcus TaxID=2608920 RepID=UPI0008872F8D|nr:MULTISPECIES: hydrogenase formation protein HypD [unclassified Ruminococcus]SDA12093.1 hydrogenase expression/formation protein HypD [Ruminococcus sp. YE78]SFW16248.1 hydrogenase expression/formation protein HypD [Ruminococcus sp. YE71]
MTESVKKARDIITGYSGRPLRIMEVCGTHTHEIFRIGLRKLLPESIDLISGPGCPVCVTAVGFIDEACWLALEKGCLICTFGDLIRVPGTEMSLAGARAKGADIRPVYSPLDAVEIAKENPDRQVVFLAVGFETTTPSACLAAEQAKAAGLKNFSLLTANKTMPNAYNALVGSADAFLYPGHVNAITGNSACIKLCEEKGVSGVVAGFTASELITAMAVTVRLLEKGEPFFRNCYTRVVKDEGNKSAMELMERVMEPCDSEWRGLGLIPMSGMKLRAEYADYDARLKYAMPEIKGRPNPACRCGDVLQGKCKPSDCKVFGKGCTPLHPVGACMVSDEGACAAYYQYSEIE